MVTLLSLVGPRAAQEGFARFHPALPKGRRAWRRNLLAQRQILSFCRVARREMPLSDPA